MSFGIFELYEMPRFPVPYPRNYIEIYSRREDLIRDYKFTDLEVDKLADGEVVRDRYCMELAPKVIRDLFIGDIIEEHGRLKASEVAEVTNSSVSSVKQTIHRFKKKLKDNIELKISLYESVERKRTRDYSVETKCAVRLGSY
jgi:hypothetical protein